jgi:hypothetical protein
MSCGRFDKEALPNPGGTIFKSDSSLYGLHISSDEDEEQNVNLVVLENPLNIKKSNRSNRLIRRRKSKSK